MTLPPITINNDSKYYPDQVARMMREYGAACRAAALEEAARVCEAGKLVGIGSRYEPMTQRECAAAIRALKESK